MERGVARHEGELAEGSSQSLIWRLVGVTEDDRLEDAHDGARVRLEAGQQQQHQLLQPACELVLLEQRDKRRDDAEGLSAQRRLLEREPPSLDLSSTLLAVS